MALSETQQKTINLGKLIVESLGRSYDVRPMSRWMAHYVAELIIRSETASGEEEAAIQAQCFEAILRLWAHRHAIPNGDRPLEDIEPITETLKRLDPNNPRYFYMGEWKRGNEETYSSVSQWTDAAMAADQAARTVVESLLTIAAEECHDETAKLWIQADLDDALTMSVHLGLVEHMGSPGADEAKTIGRLQNRISHLDRFSGMVEGIRGLLLEKLSEAGGEFTPPSVPSESPEDIDV